jgi:hypothetical protein
MSPTLVTNISEYIQSDEFDKNVVEIYARDQRRRFITPFASFGPLIVIQHSSWIANQITESATLSCVGSIGLFDMFLLSNEGTKDSSSFWIVFTRAPIHKRTDLGVVVASSIPPPSVDISVLSDTDGLLILGDKKGLSSAIVYENFYKYDTY